MDYKIDKISTRQAMILLVTMIISPAFALVPYLTAKEAMQAAYLTPIVSFLLLIVVGVVMGRIYKSFNNENLSLIDIIYSVFGKILGKIIVLIYSLFLMGIVSFYLRFYAERLVSTTFNNFDIKIFLVIMLFLVAFVMKKGLVTIARMSEIILPIILIVFVGAVFVLIPDIKLDYITPISFSDVRNISKASILVSGLWLLYVPLFFISDKFTGKKSLTENSFKAFSFLGIVSIFMIMITVGTLSYLLIQRVPYPFLSAVKQISLFNTIEKVESLIVAIWIMSDFVIITVLIHIILNILKSVFKIKKIQSSTNIFLALIFMIALILAKTKFELDNISDLILQANFAISLGLIALIYFVGKIRRVVK